MFVFADVVQAEEATKEKIGTLRAFWEDLRDNYQDDLILFGKIVLLSLVVILGAWIISRLITAAIRRYTGKVSALDESAVKVINGVIKTLIWGVAVLIILDLFGINTASILTVIGAVGLAIGLAVKDSLSNIAAGIMLFFLRPYKVGDYVDCGSVSGTIKSMGLFSTVLMTVDGVFVSAPNSVIFGTPIKNYSRNAMRRADITIGVSYKNSLADAVKVLREMMLQNDLIAKEPAPEVLVAEFADSSVNLTLRFWVATENYWTAFWDVKKALKPTLDAAGLNIPFPQRVITFADPKAIPHVEK